MEQIEAQIEAQRAVHAQAAEVVHPALGEGAEPGPAVPLVPSDALVERTQVSYRLGGGPALAQTPVSAGQLGRDRSASVRSALHRP